MEYKLRNLPCTIQPDAKLWTVCGKQKIENGIASGVLEWCYDMEDATYIKSKMDQDPNFYDLVILKWEEIPKEEEERNQCDGCNRGLPIVDGIHRGEGYDMIGCTAHLYKEVPK